MEACQSLLIGQLRSWVDELVELPLRLYPYLLCSCSVTLVFGMTDVVIGHAGPSRRKYLLFVLSG